MLSLRMLKLQLLGRTPILSMLSVLQLRNRPLWMLLLLITKILVCSVTPRLHWLLTPMAKFRCLGTLLIAMVFLLLVLSLQMIFTRVLRQIYTITSGLMLGPGSSFSVVPLLIFLVLLLMVLGLTSF